MTQIKGALVFTFLDNEITNRYENMTPNKTIKIINRTALLIGLLFQTACASFGPVKARHTSPNVDKEVADPFERLNRKVYAFNEAVDKAVIGPIARGYNSTSPKFIRKRVTNFTNNLSEPVNFGNELLQLDFQDASVSLGRFLVNSTLGLGGLFDPASKDPELQYQKEDFGQTLGTYNVPAGPYVVLPLLGPSNFRDILGRAGDIVANPVRRINFNGETETVVGINAANFLNVRVNQEGRLMTIRDSADPYVNLRSLYNQNRDSNIHEDSDPFDDLEDFE